MDPLLVSCALVAAAEMGVLVTTAHRESDVADAAEGALRIAYNTFRPAAVLIEQHVLGAKTFMD